MTRKRLEEKQKDGDSEVIEILAEKGADKAITELTNTNNIRLKTDLDSPEMFSILETITLYFELRGLKETPLLLKKLYGSYYQLRVSHKRKGRLEVLKTIKSEKEEEKRKSSWLWGKQDEKQ